MKKIIIPIVMFLIMQTIVSCQKEGIQQPEIQSTKTSTPSQIKFIKSEWLTMSFHEIWSSTTTRNLVFQLANHGINPAISYDPNTDVALAYTKIPGRMYYYYRIPGLVATSTQNLDMSYTLEPFSFNVSIWNADDHSLMPDATPFQFYSFRYIVISKTIFDTLQINWNDYYAVAAALNISL